MKYFSTMNCPKNSVPTDPFDLIDFIFRTILPLRGYTVREEQIRLCKTMYIGLTGKRISICEAEVGTGKTMAYLVATIVAKRMFETTNRDCSYNIGTSMITVLVAA